MNRVDPMGLYARGNGWSDKDWGLFEQSQTAAANAVEKALQITERGLASGGKAFEDVKKAFEKAYGQGSATRENLARIAMVLQHIGEALRDNGTKGYYANALTKAGMKAAGHAAMGGFASGREININTEARGVFDATTTKAGSPDQTRQVIMTHESSHNFGLEDVRGKFGPAYRYSEISSQALSFQRLPTDDPAGALRNADTLTSFVYP